MLFKKRGEPMLPNDFCPGVIEAEDRLYKEWKIAARIENEGTQKALNRFGPSLVEMKRASLRP